MSEGVFDEARTTDCPIEKATNSKITLARLKQQLVVPILQGTFYDAVPASSL
jgi:hypothetical protein